jgi:hypothetical protein
MNDDEQELEGQHITSCCVPELETLHEPSPAVCLGIKVRCMNREP